MKMKRVLSGVMASAIAVSGMSAFSASAETVDSSTIAAAVTGKAGITFQTDGNYTYRDITNSKGEHGVFPQKEVGCAGGANGFSTVDAGDVAINGSGTYTVSLPTSGVISIEPDLLKPANKKAWYVDQEKGVTRMGSKWDMRGSYEPPELEEGADIPAVDQWELQAGNTCFNMLCVSTDIPAYYDKDTHKCYLDEAHTKEVTVSNVSVSIPGAGTFDGDAGCWKDDVDTLCISLINVYDNTGKGNTIDTSAFPKDEGEISVTFTIKFPAEEKTDLSKKATVTVKNKTVSYTGKALKPAVTVKVGKTTLKNGTDYSLKFKNNKKPGKATVTVTGKGKYKGSKSASFIIVPKKPAKPSVKSGKKQMTVTLKKDKTASGYQITYATNSKFKSAKSVNISKNSTVKKTIKKLNSGKKYYVKSRSFIKVGKKKYYGKYSKTVKVTVK